MKEKKWKVSIKKMWDGNVGQLLSSTHPSRQAAAEAVLTLAAEHQKKTGVELILDYDRIRTDGGNPEIEWSIAPVQQAFPASAK